MIKRKFIIIDEVPFSDWYYEIFGIETLKKANYDVEVWDVRQIYLEKYPVDRVNVTHKVPIHRIANLPELRRLFFSLGSSEVVLSNSGMTAGLEETHYELLNCLRHFNGTWIAVDLAVLPPSRARLFSRLIFLVSHPRRGAFVLRSHLRAIVKRPFQKRKSANDLSRFLDICFQCTRSSTVPESLIGPRTQLVTVHSFDYDQVRRAKSTMPAPTTDYCIFLASNPPSLAFDAVALEGEWSTKRFENALEKQAAYLNRVSDFLSLPVRVAAHPRQAVGALDSKFEQFEVIYGNTQTEIERAKFVLAPVSASLGWAALYKKPIALYTFDGATPANRAALKSMSVSLGCPIWNLDKDCSTWMIPLVDKNKLSHFVETFMRAPNAENEPFWEVVIRVLNDKTLNKQIPMTT